MNITIIGTGFVGVVSAAVYASQGHQVTGLDINQDKIDSLQQGRVPFFEPGLEELLTSQQEKGNLIFTTEYPQAISQAELIIIAVGTPSKPDQAVNLDYVFAAIKSAAPHLNQDVIIAVKSTVPPGTFAKIRTLLDQETDRAYYLASLPEFLKEGSAVEDTLHPDRVVIGATDQIVFDKLEKLHQPMNAPIVKISPESAQMAKYAANAFLATRITFINQIANLCEHNQADIQEVIEGIGYDKRIGSHYWYPGLGYGGSCFPKDVKELAHYSQQIGEDSNLMITINQLNQTRIPRLMKRFGKQIGGWKDKSVAVLGLSFKPNTDDTRVAPAKQIIPYLLEAGSHVSSYDPLANWSPDFSEIKNQAARQNPTQFYQQQQSIQSAVATANVIMLLIEWPQIIQFDYTQHKADKQQTIIDTRNQLNPEKIRQAGYQYISIGRS